MATITGESNGIFSGAPTGIVINSITGEIDLDASDPGTYTVRYEINANCFVKTSRDWVNIYHCCY